MEHKMSKKRPLRQTYCGEVHKEYLFPRVEAQSNIVYTEVANLTVILVAVAAAGGGASPV